jgi:hypothetical protein
MGFTAETFDFQVKEAGIQRVAGDGCAGPWKPSMRLFQASHASRSADFRASTARLAAVHTDAPKMALGDFVPMPPSKRVYDRANEPHP